MINQYRHVFDIIGTKYTINKCVFGKSIIEQYPSTGCIAMINLMETYPNANMHLIGYSFVGYQGHGWEIEKKICQKLEKVFLYKFN